jgi:hypothetical protein
MNPFQTRLRAEALEDRLTPVSPADVFAAITTTQTNSAVLASLRDNPGTFTIPTNAPSTKATAQAIRAQSEQAAAVLDEFMGDLFDQIQANPAASAPLNQVLEQMAYLRLQALNNQGTAIVLVAFIDNTNNINAAAQKALSNALQLGVVDTNGTTLSQLRQQIQASQGTTVPGVTNTNGASSTGTGTNNGVNIPGLNIPGVTS